jgi:hypothetical protein
MDPAAALSFSLAAEVGIDFVAAVFRPPAVALVFDFVAAACFFF